MNDGQPESHVAESTIVRPAPATSDAIKTTLREHIELVELAALTTNNGSPAAPFITGLQLGLAIGIDQPGAATPLLAHIDYESARRMRLDAVPERIRLGRAAAAKDLADAALSAVPQDTGGWLQ